MGRERGLQAQGPRLVLIEWEDTSLPAPQWQWLADLAVPAELRCQTAGFLLREDASHRVLALTVGCISGVVQVSGVFRIPNRSVIRVVDLPRSPPDSH